MRNEIMNSEKKSRNVQEIRELGLPGLADPRETNHRKGFPKADRRLLDPIVPLCHPNRD
jgi:hypothetical protein